VRFALSGTLKVDDGAGEPVTGRLAGLAWL
jgi:hypothetical protein